MCAFRLSTAVARERFEYLRGSRGRFPVDRNDCSCFCLVSGENQPRTSSSFLGVDRTWLPLPAADTHHGNPIAGHTRRSDSCVSEPEKLG